MSMKSRGEEIDKRKREMRGRGEERKEDTGKNIKEKGRRGC